MDDKMKEKLKTIFDSLNDEQLERAKECKSIDELLAVVGEEGMELPDEIVDAVAGGYIYKAYPDCWKVINDYCGSVICTVYTGNKTRVEKEARRTGQSQKEINRIGINALKARSDKKSWFSGELSDEVIRNVSGGRITITDEETKESY